MTWLRRAVAALPASLTAEPSPGPEEPPSALRRRRRTVTGVSLAGTILLGASLSTKPDSPQFYGLTLGVAATWTLGGLTAGPLHLGRTPRHGRKTAHRPVLTPVLLGAGAFGVFYGCALVSRHIQILNRAISGVLQYAHRGSDRQVLLTTLANGAAEEVFFRGALYAATPKHPVAVSTAVYSLSTTATRNPALVLASVVMGALFAVQRRVTGGIQAPMLTHLTWSALMLRFLPPLFPSRISGQRSDRPDRRCDR